MKEFYEMRLESIGGLGAHLAGQILAEAAVLGMGLNGAHFSSYGSEKKGSPVKSYVRIGPSSWQPRSTSAVRQPDVVAVFHEALLADPGVTAGLEPGSTLIVNTPVGPEEVARRVPLPGVRIVTLDGTAIAVQEKSRVNTAMMGAITREASILDAAVIRQAIADTFGRKYPALVAANLSTFDRGFGEGRAFTEPEALAVEAAAAAEGGARGSGATGGPVVGYLTAPIGGVLPNAGSSARKAGGTSRQGHMPVLNREFCMDCGVCDLVCPDFCLVWRPTGAVAYGHQAWKLEGIDYQYCKGCMHCVQECPTGALTKERELAGMAERLQVPLFQTESASVGGGR